MATFSNTLAFVAHIISPDLAAANLETLKVVEVSYVTFPGWKASIGAVSSYEDLPANCKKYISFIEEYLKVPIEWIGVGPGRESMIVKGN